MSVIGGLRQTLRALTPRSLRKLRYALSATHKTMYHAPRSALVALEAKGEARFREGSRADLARLGAANEYDAESIEHLQRRLDAGDRLILAEEDGRVTFTGWISTGTMELPRAHVALPGKMSYAYKLFAVPDRRGMGLMRGFYGHVARHVLAADSDGVVACVSAQNHASAEAHRRLGFAPIGTFWDLRAAGASLAVTDRNMAEHVGRYVAIALGD